MLSVPGVPKSPVTRPVSTDDQAPHGGGDGGAIRYDEVVVNNGPVASARHSTSDQAGRPESASLQLSAVRKVVIYATIEL